MKISVELEGMGQQRYPGVKQLIIKKLQRFKAWGMAHHETGIIEIDPRCKGIKHLEITAHETTHIVAPFLSEEAVIAISAEIARVLWDEGYRRYDNDCSIPLQDEEE